MGYGTGQRENEEKKKARDQGRDQEALGREKETGKRAEG